MLRGLCKCNDALCWTPHGSEEALFIDINGEKNSMKITSIGSDSLILSLIFQMTTYLQTPVFFFI